MTYLLLFVFGIGVGVLGGLLGIGGGIALVPGLMLLFGFTQPEAQGTSLAVLIPPIGLFAAIVYYQHGFVKLPVVGWVALGFVIGAYFGARLVPAIPPAALRATFGIALLYVGFMFVLAPSATRPAALLPAGVAAVAAAIVAWLLRRPLQRQQQQPQPPGKDIEYHI